MELSPPWGAINWADTQEIPSISWNPKVQYRLHKSPPLIPILSHINPIHTIPSISPRSILIVYPPTSRSSQWSLSFWYSHQYPICIPLLPIRATCPAHLILLDWRVQVMKLLITRFPAISCHFISLRPLLNTLSLCSSLNVRDQVSHPYRTTG
jgi:hypothetical protein